MYIVIVSTDKSTNSVLKKMLSLKGHVVKTYTDYVNSYQSMMTTRPDLCITDAHLDKNNKGDVLVRQVREIYPHKVKFIYIMNDIISASVHIDNIKAFNIPINLKDLCNYINTLVN